jgi:hypothetical protein
MFRACINLFIDRCLEEACMALFLVDLIGNNVEELVNNTTNTYSSLIRWRWKILQIKLVKDELTLSLRLGS